MPTRTAQPGEAIETRQERWASSPLYHRAIKANLVAQRAACVALPEMRELLWMIQWLSTQPGELNRAAKAIGHRAEDLVELALNPEINLDTVALLPLALRGHLEQFIAAKASGQAVTAIGRAVNTGLDYCLTTRSLTVINGLPRLGKSFAAERYCEQHPGRIRYVQVPSSSDDLAFFMAIARALGITIESNAKTKNLRPRIEAALQGGDLGLALDEAHNCWPSHNYRLARPPRICWLMTALVNQRVPVAMIVTPQFFKAQQSYEAKSGWAAEQFVGRIGRYVQLPDNVSLSDLAKVARAVYPTGTETAIQTLADYAKLSSKHVAAIDHALRHAAFIAVQSGRITPTWPDVKQALREGVIPSDIGLAKALKRGDKSADLEAVLAGKNSPSAPAPRRWRGGLASVTREAADDNFSTVTESGAAEFRD